MTEKELMLNGKLYNPNDFEINIDFISAKELIKKINNTSDKQITERIALLKRLFESTGENLWVELPFQCDFGYNISVGENFFANYDCLIIDASKVTIGSNVYLGPKVCIYTAGHPIDFEVRNSQLEYSKSITIGNNVWIGGNSVINPGVKIHDNVVIGSGSIVTSNIPSGVVAAGNPCRIIRTITDRDRIFWKERLDEYNKNRNK